MQLGSVESIGDEVGELGLSLSLRRRIFRTGKEMGDEPGAEACDDLVAIEWVGLGVGDRLNILVASGSTLGGSLTVDERLVGSEGSLYGGHRLGKINRTVSYRTDSRMNHSVINDATPGRAFPSKTSIRPGTKSFSAVLGQDPHLRLPRRFTANIQNNIRAGTHRTHQLLAGF
jgi:hypothetical protein